MDSKKNIGSFFREKLSGLNANPSNDLWSRIEKDLDKKRQKRMLFWLVPAIVFVSIGIIGLLTNNNFNLVENNSKINQKSKKEVIINEKNSKSKIKSNTTISIVAKKIDTITLDVFRDSIKNKSNYKLLTKKSKLVKSTPEYDEYQVTNTYSFIVKKKKSKAIVNNNITQKSKNRVAKNVILNSKNKLKQIKNKSKLAKNKKYFVKNKKPKLVIPKNLITTNDVPVLTIVTNNDTIANIKTNETKNEIPKIVADKTPKIKAKKPQRNLKPIDSVITEDENQFDYKIYLSPYFGPIRYNNFGNGNNLSNDNDNYNQKSLSGYSYGFYNRWMFTDKVGFRIGLGRLALNSNITATKANPNTGFDFSNIQVQSGTSQQFIDNIFSTDKILELQQKHTYFEIPIEGYYVISDNKFGFATAAGASYLVLYDRSLLLKSANNQLYNVGYTKNTQKNSTTLNAHFYFTYQLTKNINFDLSPSFKYHLNGFTNIQNFKPYILSLQAGFSYKL